MPKPAQTLFIWAADLAIFLGMWLLGVPVSIILGILGLAVVVALFIFGCEYYKEKAGTYPPFFASHLRNPKI